MTCPCCGREYDLEAFAGLRLIGVQLDYLGGEFELRNCPCGDTLAGPVRPQTKTEDSNEIPTP